MPSDHPVAGQADQDGADRDGAGMKADHAVAQIEIGLEEWRDRALESQQEGEEGQNQIAADRAGRADNAGLRCSTQGCRHVRCGNSDAHPDVQARARRKAATPGMIAAWPRNAASAGLRPALVCDTRR